MSAHYPLKYSLEDGIDVTVNRTGDELYEFILQRKDGAASRFVFADDARSKDEKTASLDFDELNAVRAFWLKKHDVV